MRLQLTPEIDTRNGVVNKDARLTNTLKEESDEGGTLACIRPGLLATTTLSGNGNGVTVYENVLISVFGTTLGMNAAGTSVATVTNGRFDFCQSPL